jgi:hypothetical protein
MNKLKLLANGNLSFSISIVQGEFKIMGFSIKPKDFIASKDLETSWNDSLDSACGEMVLLMENYYNENK